MKLTVVFRENTPEVCQNSYTQRRHFKDVSKTGGMLFLVHAVHVTHTVQFVVTSRTVT